jgi:cytochrome P450
VILDLRDPAYWDDLHGALARARRDGRVARTSDGSLVLLSYADVNGALRDDALGSFALETLLAGNGVVDGPLWDWCQRFMLAMDPPEHTRLRSLVSRAFTPRHVDSVRTRVRARIRELLAPHRDAGRVEWVADVAHELPIWTICELIGVPEADRDTVKQWTLDVGLVFTNVLGPDDRRVAETALASLYDYTRGLVAERRRNPRDDLLTALVHAEEDGRHLSEPELQAMVPNLLNGGHDTTRSLLSIALVVLLDHPAERRRLEDDPAMVAGAVEEVLRTEPPVVSTMRLASTPCSLGGEPVAAGEMVHLSILAANRDPTTFADPDRFDVGRRGAPSVSFGFGAHHCVGAALARLEGQEVLTELVTTCRDLTLEIDRPQWIPFLQVRRIESLPLSFRSV